MSRKLHLTSAQADAIQTYIWQIRDLMGLSHWDVFLASKPCPKSANASVLPTEGRHVAPLSIARDWLDTRSPVEQRNDIVHELIHVVHRDQTDIIRVGLLRSGYLPPKAAHLLWELFSTHAELMVDHLANVLAPTMPLPEWTEIARAGDDMGGKPSKGTPADRRIKGNKGNKGKKS